MKLLVKIEGGPSPGVIIAGEKRDLVFLAEHLKAGAEATDEGVVPLPSATVEGEPQEWLAFEVVRSFSRARDDQKTRAALPKLAIAAIGVIAVAILYLAYRGVRSL